MKKLCLANFHFFLLSCLCYKFNGQPQLGRHMTPKRSKATENDIWTYVTLFPASGSSSQPVTKAQHEAKVCYWIKTASFNRIKQVSLSTPRIQQLKRFWPTRRVALVNRCLTRSTQLCRFTRVSHNVVKMGHWRRTMGLRSEKIESLRCPCAKERRVISGSPLDRNYLFPTRDGNRNLGLFLVFILRHI